MIPPLPFLFSVSVSVSYSLYLSLLVVVVVIQAVLVEGNSSSNSSCSSSITITTQSDADALASCDTISGTLSLSTSVSGSISLANIQTINGGLTIQDVSSLTSFAASDLQTVHGKIYIADNEKLSNLSLSDLQTVGGEIDIEENDDLRDLVFEELEKVEGALILKGVFDEIKFPSLKHAKGQTVIESHGGSFRCSSLNSLRDGNDDDDDDDDDDDNNHNHKRSSNNNGAFQGSYTCTDGSSRLSTGAKVGIAIAVIVVVLLILFLVWTVFRKQRIRRRKRNTPVDGYTALGVVRDEKVMGYEKSLPLARPIPSTMVGRNRDSDPIGVGSIPRKPLSPPPAEGLDGDRTRVSMVSTSPPVPAALMPGDRSAASPPLDADGRSLFLHPIPRRRPSETDVPLLDSGDVHEAPGSPMRRETFELDAGPVRGTHQQPINHA